MIVCDQVVAVDQVTEGLRATAQISITILDDNDHGPHFPAIPDPLLILEGEYSEGSPGVIHTILPTDADLGSNGEVTVSLSTPHPLFRFREVRGLLDMSIRCVGRLRSPVALQDGALLAVAPLDREKREMYELVIKASDKGSPPREVRR